MQRLLFSLPSLMVVLLISSCGGDKKHSKPSAPRYGPLAQTFSNAAQAHQIPMNILLAVAYKESGLNAEPSRVAYEGGQGGGSAMQGPSMAQTLVGVSFRSLGLTESAANDPEAQLNAYGAWVQEKLKQQHIQLSPSIRKNDDIYDWIWQLARLHHPEVMASKNVPILFAREMMQILNKGFLWQDAATRERIELLPLTPKLETTSFSAPVQANLRLDTRTSELFFVDYLQLTYAQESEVINHPRRIIVTHCPFSLSTCLGTEDQNMVSMQAHYVIPSNQGVLEKPIKVLQHKSPVSLTRTTGELETITDAIVIMLVGNSGRFIEGKREQSDPSWYSKEQLMNMGKVIAGVCQMLSREEAGVDYQRCRTENVSFQSTPFDGSFHFGDIPDFDPSIFWSFVQNPEGLDGDVDIQLPANQKLFASGSPVPFKLGFITGTAKLEVELLERCPTGKTVWSTLQTHYVRNIGTKNIEVTLFDQGPNSNGQHFIRVLAFDPQGKLLGWAVQDFFLKDFDKEGVPGPSLARCSAG